LDKKKIIESASLKIKELLGKDSVGHDWWHINRVVTLAKKIQEEEGGDIFTIELAAWLHDIADHKFHGGDDMAGARAARKWMEEQGLKEELVAVVVEVVKEISYKGADVSTPMTTIEGKIVQDADRLDAIGAIGIARTFAYGGSKNRLLYDPEVKVEMHDNFNAYKNSTSPTINHFYEKLLLLKDRMNTETGKRMALERHLYMKDYLDRFFNEWIGDK
jgi:uncharacterized protein